MLLTNIVSFRVPVRGVAKSTVLLVTAVGQVLPNPPPPPPQARLLMKIFRSATTFDFCKELSQVME